MSDGKTEAVSRAVGVSVSPAAALSRELEAAVEARWSDPEAFLWRARRITEAVGLLAWQRFRGKASPGLAPRLDELVNQLSKELPRAVLDDFHGLQRSGNAGVHFQFEALNYEHYAVIAAQHLAQLLRWALPTLTETPLDPAWEALFAALTDRTRRPDSPTQRLERAEGIHAKSMAVLRGDLDAAHAKIEALGAEREALNARVSMVSAMPRARLTALRLTAVGVLGALVGSVVSVVVLRWSFATPAQPTAAQAPQASAPEAVFDAVDTDRDAGRDAGREALVAALANAVSDAGPGVDAAPRAVAPCPSDTVEVRAVALTLGPLFRGPTDIREWARSTGEPRAWHVPRACIARRWLDVHSHTWAEAQALCEARGPGWRLPRALEWEALARQGGWSQLRLPQGPASLSTMEWVEDAYPAPFLQPTPSARGSVTEARHHARGPNPGSEPTASPFNSWNLPALTTSLHVRCAFAQ